MKQNLRTELKRIRNSLAPDDVLKQEQAVSSLFVEQFGHAKSFGLYYPIRNELNTLLLIAELLDLGKCVALPAIISDEMQFFEIASPNDIAPGKFAPEPAHKIRLLQPEVIAVPLLGYHKNGHRIGYGFGFYDRYFATHKDIVKVGLAFSAQQIMDDVADPLDERLDYIITEKGILRTSNES